MEKRFTMRFRIAASEKMMKLSYYPETDSLYIDLSSTPSGDSREIATGVVGDFDAQGNLVGIDIDRASVIADLSTLESTLLPLSADTIQDK